MHEPEDTYEPWPLSERPLVSMGIGMILIDASHLDIIHFRADIMINAEQMVPLDMPQYPLQELIDFAIIPTLGSSSRQKRLFEEQPQRLRSKMRLVQQVNVRGQLPGQQKKPWGRYRG